MRPHAIAPHQGSGAQAAPPGAEQVRLERLMDDGQVGVDPALPRVVVDRRVVDQDVQPAVSLLDGPEASIDAGIVGDIELNELRIECVGGRAPLLLVARGQDRSEAVLDQLPHDLATDPSIRTRN
jgi:hypothetical protein